MQSQLNTGNSVTMGNINLLSTVGGAGSAKNFSRDEDG